MTYEHIIFEVDEGIATITFNRPKALNALNSALLKELAQALDAVAANEDIRVLVLTGAGEKAFVAGADINELAACDSLSGKLFAKTGQDVINRLPRLSIPVIAAVNGYALGGGRRWPWPAISFMPRTRLFSGFRKSLWGLSPDLAAPSGCRVKSGSTWPRR